MYEWGGLELAHADARAWGRGAVRFAGDLVGIGTGVSYLLLQLIVRPFMPKEKIEWTVNDVHILQPLKMAHRMHLIANVVTCTFPCTSGFF